MGATTAIAWTDHSFNPWWGCARVSPGCANCYAEAFAKRTGNLVWGKSAERRRFGDKHWNEPLRWDRAAVKAGRPALVFCASMADVFEDRNDLLNDRTSLWRLIEATPHLIWQLLTKRPENVLRMVPLLWTDPDDWPPNVWVGTTVEDQQRADERLPHLLNVPAPVRFVSCEPLLGPVSLADYLPLSIWVPSPSIDWIIVGGESGPHHRPLNLNCARSLRLQAEVAKVPFFFKQVGGVHPTSGGDLLDGERLKAFPAQALRTTGVGS